MDLPSELVYCIIDYLDVDDLLNFCLASREWVVPCQRRLFRSVSLEYSDAVDPFLDTLCAFPRLCAYPRELALNMGQYDFNDARDIADVIVEAPIARSDHTLEALVSRLPKLRSLEVMEMMWQPLNMKGGISTFRFLTVPSLHLTSLSLVSCVFWSFSDLTHVLRRCPHLEALNLYNIQYAKPFAHAEPLLEFPEIPLRLCSLRVDQACDELFQWPLSHGVDLSAITTLDAMELCTHERDMMNVGAVLGSLTSLVDLRIGFTGAVPEEHARGGQYT